MMLRALDFLNLSHISIYLKILRVPYFLENTNLCITSNVIEKIIKNTHIFNNTVLVYHLCIIKRFLKSDMTVIWVDIWNSQNSTKVKYLINKCFNIGQKIATIKETNMNSGVPQHPNCWKWEYITFACCTHSSQCQKYNSPYKIEYYREMVWCYKANFNTNPPGLETKKGEPCTHLFKYINCKEKYQADSNSCSFWKHRFNRE